TAGGMGIGYFPGTNSGLGGYRQGAQIKNGSTEIIGQNETYFFFRPHNPLKKIEEQKRKTVGDSRPGGPSEGVLLGLKAERHIDFNAVATGAMDATFTMVMTKQIDVGYSILPNQLDTVAKGDIRVLFSGDDVKSQRNISGRTIIASADFVK